MDGRIAKTLGLAMALGVASSVGCQMLQKQPAPAQEQLMPNATANKGWFGNSGPKYGPPAEQIPVRTATKKGQGMKPETDIAVADVELEAAYDEKRTGEDRDRLVEVARQRLQSVLQKDPKNKAAQMEMAKLYTWAGDRDRAMQAHQELYKQYPKDKDVVQAMARSQARFEDWEGACRSYQIGLTLDPGNRIFQKYLSHCLARCNRWDDAFESLMKVMPEWEARTLLALTLIDLGRPQDGKDQLKMALEKNPNNDIARGILEEMNAPTEAIPQPVPVQQVGFGPGR